MRVVDAYRVHRAVHAAWTRGVTRAGHAGAGRQMDNSGKVLFGSVSGRRCDVGSRNGVLVVACKGQTESKRWNKGYSDVPRSRMTNCSMRASVIASSSNESQSQSISGFVLEIQPEQISLGGVTLTSTQKQTLDQFWFANGVSSKTHRTLLTKTASKKGLFRDLDRLVEKMIELEDVAWKAVGIVDLDLGKVVGRYPKALYFDSEFLVERLRLLRDLLPGADLKKLLERNPQVLTMDMTHTLPAKMRELSKLLPNSDVVRLIETHPKILSVNVGGKVRSNLQDLKGLLAVANVVDTAVEVMVVHNPRLLTSDIKGTVSKRAMYLEKLKPGSISKYSSKPASLSRILCASEKALDRVLFVDLFDPENVKSVIVTVNPPSVKWRETYPGFEAWQAEIAAEREK